MDRCRSEVASARVGIVPEDSRQVRARRETDTLEDAIRRFTSRPASRMGIPDRGILRPGFKADITIFDPDNIRDRSTYKEPKHYSEGILHVLVNGKAVVSEGRSPTNGPANPFAVLDSRDRTCGRVRGKGV